MNISIQFCLKCALIAILLSLGGHSLLAQANFHLVKDLMPGAEETYINEMKAIHGYLYFTDMEHGLLRTDGTKEGTIAIENEEHQWYFSYTETQGGFYFIAQNWAENTYALRKTTGETGASVTITQSFSSISELLEIDGILYFIADDGVHGKEIWKYDGVAASMVKDIGSGNAIFSPRDLRACNGTLFFATDDGSHGVELWKSDGTEAGTILVKDIYPGLSSGFPSSFEILNGELYFTANDGVNGQEPWKTDGSENGTVVLKDIANGFNGSTPSMLTKAGDAIYFEAFDPDHGTALWKTLGTEATTVLVKDIHPGIDRQSHISYLTNVNGVLFFAGNDGVNGKELWKSDGSETLLLKDLTPGSENESELKNLSSSNNHLFFVSKGQLWKSDGGECNTVQMTFADGVSFMDWLPYQVGLSDKLFLLAGTEDTGGELYYYDYSDGGPKGVCDQHVDFADIQAKTYGDDPFALDATASSGSPVTFTSSDLAIVAVDGNMAMITGAGEVTITATQRGDMNYLPAIKQQTIVVKKKDQSITFDALPDKIFGEDPFTVTATSSSGLPVTFSSDDSSIASVTDNEVIVLGPGRVTITAIQNGDDRYLAAAPVSQALVIKLITAVGDRDHTVVVYPNPVSDYLIVKGFSPGERLRVLMRHVDGKLVEAEELSGKQDYQLDLSSLTPGIYVITVTSENRSYSQRIIKR